jgi:hypothetical protein
MSMQRKQLHGLIFFGVGLFLLSKSLFWGVILTMVGVYKLTGSAVKHHRQSSSRFRQDAYKAGVVLPDDPQLIGQLDRLYRRFEDATKRFPQLESEYTELIRAMWLELAAATSLKQWKATVGEVMDGWPTPWNDRAGPVKSSLDRARSASAKWREAREEAMGH